MIGVANSRKPYSIGQANRPLSCSATLANSVIALSSRLPWPHIITAMSLMSCFPFVSSGSD